MKKLYFIANQGCDATTYGLVELTDEEFINFKAFIENLNKNSHYVCMPTIMVYRAKWEDLRGCDYNKSLDCWDGDYIDQTDVFYFGDKTYTFSEKWFSYYTKWEQVIGT